MNLPSPEQLLDRLVAQLAPHIQEGTALALVGMHTGGVWVMQALVERLDMSHLDSGTLDTAFYRDDYSQRGLHDDVKPSRIAFDVAGRHILLIDDVLNTGRSVRAAMNLLFDYGRPASIRLAVLVDRGGRELPICADYAGLRLELPARERIKLDRTEDGRLSLKVSRG
ncbi:MAG TPA: bifunctional pyr operon transcriptional regulator/uracil phosphoribosyltransferase PyrR [Thiobacillaceae bacterium]|nr:bifunctional pyr operon transcriptional regulator/uracil phosphoribosyltransferase PyrR [Thiobacillaceae bacterium]HNU64879.1 bifunctional pyr operon transcriptional regulator/uracil phosphoribosyltransferase PyrR [Thiobacillaceae bacterium]